MLPKSLILWVCVNICYILVASADDTKMYLNYILSGHQHPHQRETILIPPPIRPRLPLHMIHPMYSPLHHACDQFTAIENNMLRNNYSPGVRGLLPLPKVQLPQEENKKKDLFKEKWERAKFILKGSLGYALNNNEPYYPLDPTANLKTPPQDQKKKGVIVLADKLGLQVFSNHPVTVVGDDGEQEELLPAGEKPPPIDVASEYNDDDDYDTTPNDIYKPGSHRPEVPTMPYGMPSTGPFITGAQEEDVSSPTSPEPEPPHHSSERPSLQSSPAANPTTELQQQLSPATSHPVPAHHHYPPPVTDAEQEMQTHDPRPTGSQDRRYETRQEERANDLLHEGRQASRAPAFDLNAERRRHIMQHKPPDSIFLNLPRVVTVFDSVNSTERRSHNSGTPALASDYNPGWKPVTGDPVRRGEPKITFEVQTNDPVTGTAVDQEVVGDTSNHVMRHVQLRPHLGTTESQRQVTTMMAAVPLSTASSIILSSSASYFASVNSSLSDRSEAKGH